MRNKAPLTDETEERKRGRANLKGRRRSLAVPNERQDVIDPESQISGSAKTITPRLGHMTVNVSPSHSCVVNRPPEAEV